MIFLIHASLEVYGRSIRIRLKYKEIRYPFITLDDGAEIVHSEMLEDGKVRVYVEKPDEKDCFHNMTCWLPSYEITENNGYTSCIS